MNHLKVTFDFSSGVLLIVERKSGILFDGGAEDQGDGVVQQALTEDQAVQVAVHFQVLQKI